MIDWQVYFEKLAKWRTLFNMQMKKIFMFQCFFLIAAVSHSQLKKQILGTWVKVKMENLEKQVTPEILNRNKQFTKYIFEKNNNLFVSLNANEKGNLLKYKIEKNVLNLGFNKFEIEKINRNNLVLVEFINNRKRKNSIRTYYLKEGFYLKQLAINNDDTLTRNDAILYFESDKVYPKFKNADYGDVKEFIQPFVEGISQNQNSFSYATFIIDTKGNVNDVQIHHHINKDYDKRLEKAIKRTKGMWVSPVVNGKTVPVVKNISFNYIQFPDFKKKGNKLIIEGKNSFSKSFKVKFKDAVKLYLKNEFEKSLNLLDEINSTNASITYLKRNIYNKIGDTTNFQLTSKKLEKSKFSYLIE